MEAKVREFLAWQGGVRLEAVAERLRKRGFAATVCTDRAAALERVRAAAAEARTVAFGGSITAGTLGVQEALKADGKEIVDHGVPGLSTDEKRALMRRELTADLFVASVNALTDEGVLVNKDGVGNRVAAMIFGPAKTLLLVGRNKLVRGGVPAALSRIEAVAGPTNCHRLSKKTPCAVTGSCAHCVGSCPESICRVTTVIEQCPSLSSIEVILINEDLGL